MANETRVVLKGSERKALPGSKEIGPVDLNQVITRDGSAAAPWASASTRRRPTPALRPRHLSTPISREDYGVINGADPNALNAVEEFAHRTVRADGFRTQSRAAGRWSCRAPCAAMQNAFGTKLESGAIVDHWHLPSQPYGIDHASEVRIRACSLCSVSITARRETSLPGGRPSRARPRHQHELKHGFEQHVHAVTSLQL